MNEEMIERVWISCMKSAKACRQPYDDNEVDGNTINEYTGGAQYDNIVWISLFADMKSAAKVYIEKGYPIDERCLCMAIVKQHEDIFHLLMQRGCRMSEECMGEAVMCMNIEMIKSLLHNGCPFNGRDVLFALTIVLLSDNDIPFVKGCSCILDA